MELESGEVSVQSEVHTDIIMEEKADYVEEDSETKLTLAVTSDEESRDSGTGKPSVTATDTDVEVKDAINNSAKAMSIVEQASSKRKQDDIDWSSDEEEFAGFDECNGEPVGHNPYKKIKEELPSESEDLNKKKQIPSERVVLKQTQVKEEGDQLSEENKPPNTEKHETLKTIPKATQELKEKVLSSANESNKPPPLKDPIYRKPFEMGWKRELVYRAVPGVSKDKGEVYYITPTGKKIRTKSDIQLNLTPGLTIDNFTFAKEPLGMGPDEELIRSAKPIARTTPVDITLGKRVPKPKVPKGASPPPQGWTSVRAVKSSSNSSSPRPVSTPRISDDADAKTPISSTKTTTKSGKTQKKGEPCTIQCVLAMGMIPQLQCVKCLCLFHHECVGLGRSDSGIAERTTSGATNLPAGSGGYICESCKVEAVSAPLPPPTKPTASSPPKTQTQSTSTSQSATNINSTQRRQNDTAKDSTKQHSTNTSTNSLPSNKMSNSHSKNNNNSIELSASLPQSIAVIKGRKYVVIRKPSVPLNAKQGTEDIHTKGTGNENSTGNSSTLSLTTGDDTPVRKRVTGTRSSKTGENLAQASDSLNQQTQRLPVPPTSLSMENFATNFFGNVSIGYDILLLTFQYLKVQELLRAACVCRVWNVVANHRSLWKTVRMKNSQVNDWTGLAAALKRNETKHLDLRKMISSTNGDEMWASFSKHIKTVETLETIDLCRCSSKIVESLFTSNPQLKVINAVTIKDDILNLEPISCLENLQELRLKSIDGCSLEGDLQALRGLKNLKHLSLTSLRELGIKEIEVLGELTLLESLELGECSEFGISFATEVLLKLQSLERLRLEKGQDNCCTLEILEAIAQLPNLAQLELVNFDIKTGFDDKLSQCNNLKRLLLIPTYISQSATTNNIVLSAVLKLSKTLQILTWAVTLELLRVTALYVDQCDNKKKDKKFFDESIPVLKPVPGIVEENDRAQRTASDVPQVEILPLVRVEKILISGMPTTKFKILKVPYHATWRQNLVDIQ